jgi:hypothetical protein
MGESRKGVKTKTVPIPEGEATVVGQVAPGWEVETTVVGAPAGWELATEEEIPQDWREERTLEDRAAGPHPPPPLPTQRPERTEVMQHPERTASGSHRPKKREVEAPQRSAPPASRPPIEVEVRKISTAAAGRRAPPTYEIWTKNRVYALDAALACIDVIDLASGQSDHRHPFIGGQLVGGQRHVSETTELTFPLPTPGSEAVLQLADSNGRPRLVVTSKVTRVILHVQIVKVADQQRDDAWNKIASSRQPKV